jgi:hypothetical protein
MVRIKVTLPDLPETDGSLRGSSPVRGNAYAGFLGGLGLATAPGYPTEIVPVQSVKRKLVRENAAMFLLGLLCRLSTDF